MKQSERILMLEKRLTKIENHLKKNRINEGLFDKKPENILQAKQKLDKQITKLLAKADKNMQKANSVLQEDVNEILLEIHEMIQAFNKEHGTKLTILDQHIKEDNLVFGNKEWLNNFIDNIKDIKSKLSSKYTDKVEAK